MSDEQLQTIVNLLERVVLAVEQISLEMDAPEVSARGVSGSPAAGQGAAGWVCPIHGHSKVVAAGVSARTGKAYSSFIACATPFCPQRPAMVLP
jgi:hypothetical protein